MTREHVNDDGGHFVDVGDNDLHEKYRVRRGGTAEVEAAAPQPVTGEFWFDTASVVLKVYDGSTWQSISGGGASSLQAAYNGGTTITLNATPDPVTFQNKVGGVSTDKVFVINNTAGSEVLSVKASGALESQANVDAVGRIQTDAYLDVGRISAPSSPTSSHSRIFGRSTGGEIGYIDDSGDTFVFVTKDDSAAAHVDNGFVSWDTTSDRVQGVVDLSVNSVGGVAAITATGVTDLTFLTVDGTITLSANGTGQDIVLTAAGDVSLNPTGDIVCNGNDITGVASIDVTNEVSCESVVFDEAASVPGGAPSAGTSVVWTRSDTPSSLMHTDDTNKNWRLGLPTPLVLDLDEPRLTREWLIGYAQWDLEILEVIYQTQNNAIDFNIVHQASLCAGTQTSLWAAVKSATTTETASTSFTNASVSAGKAILWKPDSYSTVPDFVRVVVVFKYV